MSVWYHLDVTAIAANRAAVAKFFNLEDSFGDVRTDTFEFSFGGKNAPSLTLKKIVQQNPDLVFLVKQSIEDTVQWLVTKFDVASNEHQVFWIQDFGNVTNQVSKKLLEEYEKALPGLALKHLNGEKGFETFRWNYLLNDFAKVCDKLNRAKEYEEMVNPWKHYDVKTYIVEYKCKYGDEFHPEYQGPMSLSQAQSLQDRISSTKNAEIKDLKLREVEPR